MLLHCFSFDRIRMKKENHLRWLWLMIFTYYSLLHNNTTPYNHSTCFSSFSFWVRTTRSTSCKLILSWGNFLTAAFAHIITNLRGIMLLLSQLRSDLIFFCYMCWEPRNVTYLFLSKLGKLSKFWKIFMKINCKGKTMSFSDPSFFGC